MAANFLFAAIFLQLRCENEMESILAILESIPAKLESKSKYWELNFSSSFIYIKDIDSDKI